MILNRFMRSFIVNPISKFPTSSFLILENFCSYFRDRDYNELKMIELEQDHSKKYLQLRDGWKIALEKKRLRKERLKMI
jgi:hypothetical protein